MNLEQLNDLTEYPKIIAWKAVKFSISSRAKLIPRHYDKLSSKVLEYYKIPT